MRTIGTLCVFCGSSEGTDPAYVASAKAFGEEMAARKVNLVYGGGGKGLMGTLATTVKSGFPYRNRRHFPIRSTRW
jgi:predicted Rossmann-fold nucleotide-binding protein